MYVVLISSSFGTARCVASERQRLGNIIVVALCIGSVVGLPQVGNAMLQPR